MPTNPYGSDALQALNRILQYQQKRDKDEVAHSLAIMEYKAKQDVSKYNLASKMLEDSSKYNTMLKTQVVDDFLKQTNLRRFADTIPAPEKGDDRKEIQDDIDDIAKALREKKYYSDIKVGDKNYGKVTFDQSTSQELAGALYAYKISKDPSILLDFAVDVHNAKQAGVGGATAEQGRIVNALMGLQYDFNNENNLKTLSHAVNSKRNDEVIMKERMELMQGDFEFQEQLMSSTEPTEKEKIGQSLQTLDALQAAEQIEKHGLIKQQDQEASESFWDATGNVVGTTATAAGVAAPIIAGGAAWNEKQIAEGMKEFNDRVGDNIKRHIEKNKNSMSSKEFQNTYKMNKTTASTAEGQKVLEQQAKEFARKNRSTIGRWYTKFVDNPYQWFKKMDLKWENVNWKPTEGIRTTLSYGAPLIVPMTAGAIGSIFGETGEKIGKSAGHGYSAYLLQNQIKGTAIGGAKRTFMNWLSSGAAKAGMASISGKLAGYAALSQADSPVIPVMDLVALGLSIKEVYELYNTWASEVDY